MPYLLNFHYPELDRNTYNNYCESLERHIGFVVEAGKRVGVPLPQLFQHDQSKWSDKEFPQYANYFYHPTYGKNYNYSGDEDEYHVIQDGFNHAWANHIRLNPHHRQHWRLIRDSGETVPLEIPNTYVQEMVADWMGASMAYTGSWDMSSWLNSNFNTMIYHPNTRNMVLEVLRANGYLILPVNDQMMFTYLE